MRHSLKLSKTIQLSAIVIIVLSAVGGCSKRYSDLPAFSSIPVYDTKNGSVGRFKTSYLADQLDSYYRGTGYGPIAVTTFVDINNLYSTSAFGRTISEHLISELAMKGYDVIEMRHSDVVQILMGQGEFGLSQEVKLLKKAQDLAGIVVGTYTVSNDRVYLNSRILDPTTSLVRSVGSVEIELDEEITKLLRQNAAKKTLERIPVRPLGASLSRLETPDLNSYSQRYPQLFKEDKTKPMNEKSSKSSKAKPSKSDQTDTEHSDEEAS